ncbi:MAG: hypothetical protein JWN04_5394 [Myxococcaceae bacterium]|nr:hypothetical protein [Myxococcaceae bacterium]
MTSPAYRSPLLCVVGLVGALSAGLSACHSDPTHPGLDEDPNFLDDAGNHQGKGVDAGRGKDAGRDGKADPLDKPDSSVDPGCGNVRAAADLQRGPADIVIVLDTSGSMADKICNVSTQLTTFAAGVGPDTHVVGVYEMGVLGVVTAVLCGNQDPLAATPLAMDSSRYLHVPVNVDSWRALTDLVDNFDAYKGFLRADAPTNFVVVSDDNSSLLQGGLSAADFTTKMTAKLGHPFLFHAIVADGQNGCSGSSIGTEYLTLADQTHGVKLPICSTDWSGLFVQLQEAVASSAPIPCDFEIPASPAGGMLDTEQVRVVFTAPASSEAEFPRADDAPKCGSQRAWYYNDQLKPTRVELCPAACESVKQGGNVNITFDCAPTRLL